MRNKLNRRKKGQETQEPDHLPRYPENRCFLANIFSVVAICHLSSAICHCGYAALRLLRLIAAVIILIALSAHSQTNGAPEIAFSRIIHGWTNYSTAFNATHDTAANGDYASVGSFYTPTNEVTPLEYAAILIWSEARTPDFSRFQFRVFIWSNLDAFIQDPRQGDVATWNFTAPTGGSTSVRDTTTRGGRPAYELRFSLTNAPITLSNGHSYVLGFAARTDTQANGDLFVPTANSEGLSDVQAGDLVVGGWQYLVNAGGNTIYFGQLAVELVVAPWINPPRMEITRTDNFVRISWPAAAQDFVLESLFNLASGADWLAVEAEPFEEDGQMQVILPATFSRQWFRLRRRSDSSAPLPLN
jgi:hypothetical protein